MVGFEGLIGRAIMASDGSPERQDAEDMILLLTFAQRRLADYSTLVVIDGGADGTSCMTVAKWVGSPSVAEIVAEKGWRVIDGRNFTRDGRRRKVRASKDS